LRKSLAPVFLVGTFALCQLGCSTNAPPYSPSSGAGADTVFILPFDQQESLDQYGGPTDFGTLFSDYLAGALQERGIPAVAVPRAAELPQHAHLVVRGTLLDVDPGSWNLRFWIGFGAGRAFVKARVRLEEGPQGGVLLERQDQARSLTWQFQENILRRVSSKLARAFAREIGREVRSRPAT
jgi:hypothetical protein